MKMFSKEEKGANIPVGYMLEVIFNRESQVLPLPLSLGSPHVLWGGFYMAHLN